jgi:hypothetical protein
MKLYLIRSLKYLLQSVLLLAALFALMYYTGSGNFSSPQDIVGSSRGYMLLALVVALAATYPAFGYVNRPMRGDIEADREKIVRAFHMGGYTLVHYHDGKLVFRTSSTFKRLINLGQDAVTVTRGEGGIVMSGLRKEVVKAAFRLGAMIE